jgi:hypothetical protein
VKSFCSAAGLSCLLVVLCGCGGGGGGAGTTSTAVPDVVGEDKLTAEAAITAAGFVVGTETTEATATVPSGGVLSQSPGAGVRAASGSVVNLVFASPVQLHSSATLPSDSGRTSFTYLTVNLWANAVVWDATNGVLQVVTNNSSPTHASEVLSINPGTGAIVASHAVPVQGLAVAVSADGQYVYVGGDAGGGVERFDAKTLAPELAIPVGNSATYVQDIQVSPTDAHTFAVSAWYLQPMNQAPGVAVFDDAVMRPTIFDGTYAYNGAYPQAYVGNTNWSPDGTVLYVFNQVQEGLYGLAVSPSGVTLGKWLPWVFSGGIGGRIHGNLAYTDSGAVVDLAGSGQWLGQFPYSTGNMLFRAELLASGKSFSVQDHIGYSIDGLPFVDGLTLWASDLTTYAAIDSTTFLGIASATFGKLYAWGTNGIAWADAARLLIGSGSFTSSGGGAPAPGAPPSVASGNVAGSNGTLAFQVFNAGANDVSVDACGHLYVATAGTSAFLPNSVVVLDPATAAVLSSGYAGSEPDFLAVSDECSEIYAALGGSGSVVRLAASTMTLDETIPLPIKDMSGVVVARSLSVAPGAPHTVAMATEIGSGCLAGDNDVRVYDDLVQRPVAYTSSEAIYAIRDALFGTSANTLFGYNSGNINLVSLTVDSSGVYNSVNLASLRGGLIEDSSRLLSFDPSAGRIYDPLGDVFDIINGTTVAPISLNATPAETDQCGTLNDALTTDSSSGKIFVVAHLTNTPGLEVDTYDRSALNVLATATIPLSMTGGDIGYPVRIVRSSPASLAVVTTAGYLMILNGPMLDP